MIDFYQTQCYTVPPNFCIINMSPAMQETLTRSDERLNLEARQQRTITEWYELDVSNFEEIRQAYALLSDRKSMWHFVTPVESPRHLQKFAKRADIHLLGFFNTEGTMVSTATVEDGPETKTTVVGSNEISRIAVTSYLQAQIDEPSTDDFPGVGTQTLIHTLRYGFTTPTYSGRIRDNMYIWLTVMAGSGRMYDIARKAGLSESMRGTPVTKKWPNGTETHHEAVRLDIDRGRYMTFESEGYYDAILEK